jgi:hypothetical protein
MERTSAQLYVNLSLLRSNALKFQPQQQAKNQQKKIIWMTNGISCCEIVITYLPPNKIVKKLVSQCTV